jgi:N-acetylglucosaminyldiphosphoundecaprenol N-acetyl-beta-D-mannosaminyltransferase
VQAREPDEIFSNRNPPLLQDPSMMHTRVNILGMRVSAINMPEALATIDSWIANRRSEYVCVTPAHVVMDGYWNPDVRGWINRAGMATPDGMGIVWLLKAKGCTAVSRVYGPDLLLALCERGLADGRRHFFYGGEPGVADTLAARLSARFPGLKVTGTFAPPFRPSTPAEDAAAIRVIEDSKADILWIGIGSPRQEQWMAEHLGKVRVPVMIGVGAAFDFLSGRKRQAPRWIQRVGLEWLFRLGNEPRRLWRRYAQYPLFFLLVLFQALRITRYE